MGKADKCSYCGMPGTIAHGLCIACYQRQRRYGCLEYKRYRPRKYGNEIIKAMKKRYPKFSKVTLCMIRNPAYGIDLSREAKKYLKEAEKNAHKKETDVGNTSSQGEQQRPCP